MKQNLPILNNVTYPRFGAYSELVDPTVGVTHVVDLTICYDDLEHPPSIVDILGGRRVCEVHFYYRIHPITKNHDDVRSERWLREQWQLKDKMLTAHYAIMRNLKHRTLSNCDSTRISINGSFRSKASYSSMLLNMSKEQLNVLKPSTDEEQSNKNMAKVTTTSSTGPSSNFADLVINKNQQNCPHQSNGGELIKLVDNNTELMHYNYRIPNLAEITIVQSDNHNQNHQSSLDSTNSTATAPNTCTTDKSISGDDGSDPSVVQFDRTKGRSVVLSWKKIILIHIFYFSICLLIYEVIVVAVSKF